MLNLYVVAKKCIKHLFSYCLLLLLICGAFYSFAQTNINTEKRPKIGLALSGGGAKGLCHIGVLQVLEKAGIKFDYIVGTSMGSIIGALYASGYSADSIAVLAKTQDWDYLLANTPELRQISIEEKADFGRFLFEIPIENKKIRLPRGVIDGQELSLRLSYLFSPVYQNKSFLTLPIPFTCIATDITTGDIVVLDSGNLAEAVRASMAIPSIFTPVEYDNRLLVDGGIVRNFPVSHVKDMGADFVIGINLSKGLLRNEEINSLFDIMNQSMFLSDGEDTKKQRELCDFLIEPDLSGYTAASFYAVDSLIKRGYEAALQVLPELLRVYSSGINVSGKPIRDTKVDSVLISDIELVGVSRANEELVIDRLGIELNNKYSLASFPNAIQQVFGTRTFRKLSYQLIPNHPDKARLQIRAIENPFTFSNVSLNYNSFSKASFILNVTTRNIIGKNNRLSATINLGDMLRFKSDFFKYIGKKKNHSFGISVLFDRLSFPVFNSTERVVLYNKLYGGVDLKYQIANMTTSSYGVGLRREYIGFVPTLIGVGRSLEGSMYHDKLYLFHTRNTLNRHYFPKSGVRINGELAYFHHYRNSFSKLRLAEGSIQNNNNGLPQNFSDSTVGVGYLQLKFIGERIIKVSKSLYVKHNWVIALSINPERPNRAIETSYNNFIAGGLIPQFNNQVPFVGLTDFQLRTNNLLATGINFQYEVIKNIFITPKVNGMIYAELIDGLTDLYSIQKTNKYVIGYGISLGYLSFLGPIEFTLMQNVPLKNYSLYVNIGHTFVW